MYKVDISDLKKGKTQYFSRIGTCVFLFLGLLWLVVYPFLKQFLMDGKVMADEIIWDSYGKRETKYEGTYLYNVDGVDYKCVSKGSYSTSNNKLVHYYANNPGECLLDFEINNGTNFFTIFAFIIVLIPLIIDSIKGLKRINKEFEVLKILKERGTLFKNLSYKIIRRGTKYALYQAAISLNLTLPSGRIIELVSDRYGLKNKDKNGFVDVLIDLDDETNYYIDFNIEKE